MQDMVWKRRAALTWWSMLAVAWLDQGCADKDVGPKVTDREVTVACGRCVFAMEEAKVGCPWAVELDGKHYIIQGQVPQDHMSHAPDGICNMPRRAIVSGQVRGDRFVATKVQLKPAEAVPSTPRFTPEDVH